MSAWPEAMRVSMSMGTEFVFDIVVGLKVQMRS